MDQILRASLSHTHYWYEVGIMLKVLGQEQYKRSTRMNDRIG